MRDVGFMTRPMLIAEVEALRERYDRYRAFIDLLVVALDGVPQLAAIRREALMVLGGAAMSSRCEACEGRGRVVFYGEICACTPCNGRGKRSAPMSNEDTMSSRPWTPGPWVAAPLGSERAKGMVRIAVHFDIAESQYRAFHVPTMNADAELIALAPDMAEAILAWVDCECDEHNDHAPCSKPLLYVYRKLKAIGGDDDQS